MEVSGTPIEQIVAAAQEPEVAALVLGSRGGRGGPQPAGHTALAVITHIARPVAIVPPGADAFRSNKEVIEAQYSAAEPQVRSSEAATGVGDDMADIGVAMQRVLDKTETMKARARAVEQLQPTGKFEEVWVLSPSRPTSTSTVSSSSSVHRALLTMSSPAQGGARDGQRSG